MINEIPAQYTLNEELIESEFKKHFSWKISDNSTTIKTVDKTVLEEMSTGVPKEISYFFNEKTLSISEKINIKIYINNNVYDAFFTLLKNGRHRLSFNNIKKELKRIDLNIGHKIWFDKIDFDRFMIYITDEKFNFILAPSFTSTDTMTDAFRFTKTRVGQSLFRSRVILTCQQKCVITGLKEQPISILNASHIKPWKESNNNERLDGENGLLLSPHLDKLFDKHLITFNGNKQIIPSKILNPEVLKIWDVSLKKNYELTCGQMDYMKHHFERFRKIETLNI